VRPDRDPELRFEEAGALLLGLVADDVDAGLPPAPALVAFAGDRPLGFVRLRPVGPGEVVQALLEVLALLLPLGADRVALALPGRGWWTDDPEAAPADGRDRRVVLLTVADASVAGVPVRTTLHPFTVIAGCCRWQPEVAAGTPDAPVVAALGLLLAARDELAAGADRGVRLAAQFGRALLLGHELVLHPDTAQALVVASGR
jgi:hypothetical protein